MHVPVVLRVLPDCQLQKRQILPARLLQIRVVIELNTRRLCAAAAAALILQHLMDGMHPPKAKARVRLFYPEHASLASIRQKAPCVAVAQALRAAVQCPLHRRAPPRMKYLIEIGTDAQIRVLRHQPQGAVARSIKAPWLDTCLCHMDAVLLQDLDRPVCRAGIQDIDAVCLGHGFGPACGKRFFIFADGVDIDPVHAYSPFRPMAAPGLHWGPGVFFSLPEVPRRAVRPAIR